MAFLDDIMQKTKDTAETMKLNGAISDEEKRIQALYLEIGKKYFELHGDDFEPALEEEVLSIKEANTKIADYNEQIKRLKGIVRCSVCGGEVPYGAPFCSSCGSKMMNENTVEPAAESNVRRCRNCGVPLTDGVAFCTNCGTKAEEVAAPAPAPVVETPAPAPVVEAPAPAPAPVAAPAPAGRFCTKCGTAIAEGMAFCTGCGTPVAAPAPTTRFCTGCGAVLAEGMAFCTNCGTKA